MEEYEIRILSGKKTILIMEEVHPCDRAAIQAGRQVAVDRPFEVWRGLDCIYGSPNFSPVAAPH